MDTTALILVIIGALNWGAQGLFGVDFISSMFGGDFSVASRIIYTLVGLGGVWAITLLFREHEHASIGDIPNEYHSKGKNHHNYK